MLLKIQNYLIPSFLKRLDFWLMTHKPHIWRTRGHFVIFYSLLAAVVMYIGGRLYPQVFADFFNKDNNVNNAHVNDNLVFYLTCFIGFVSVGIMMWWWQSIQKFGYRRTNIGHFLIEIGIYTLGLFTISMFILGFDKGFSYRQAFELEKNSREDSLWVVQNNFFQYGYMPHFQPNKEYNFKAYFKEGEELSQKMALRESVVVNLNFDDDEEQYRYNKYNKAQGSTDAFSLSHWEYPKNQKLYVRPPQYKTPADYVNKILTNDTFWKQEEKRLKFKEDDNVSREFLTDMTQADINNLIDEVYPKYFKRINYFGQTQWLSRALVKQWVEKRMFLESLSDQEILIYKEYLAWLKGNFALYAPQPIISFEKNAAQGFFNKRSINVGDNFVKEKEALFMSIYIGSDEYFDENKGELAGEKLLNVFEKLDLESLKYYLQYLQNEGYQEGIKANKKNPQYAPSCKNYFTQFAPKSIVDSLYHYDYYLSNIVTEKTWLNIIADEYAQYVANKYSEKDYQRLKDMMQLNGFEDVAAKSKNNTIQKISQLHQVDDYSSAINQMLNCRKTYLTYQKITFSFFTLAICFLFAIMFYITTLSTGLQFWVSAFIGGFFIGLLVFLQQILTRYGGYKDYSNYAIYPNNNNSLNSLLFSDNAAWNKFLMIFFGGMVLILGIILIFKKVKMLRANIWFNVIIGSSLFGLYAAIFYWEHKVEITMREEHNKEYYSMSIDERIRLITLILLVAIGIYLILTWLFKRHLTLSKKK